MPPNADTEEEERDTTPDMPEAPSGTSNVLPPLTYSNISVPGLDLSPYQQAEQGQRAALLQKGSALGQQAYNAQQQQIRQNAYEQEPAYDAAGVPFRKLPGGGIEPRVTPDQYANGILNQQMTDELEGAKARSKYQAVDPLDNHLTDRAALRLSRESEANLRGNISGVLGAKADEKEGGILGFGATPTAGATAAAARKAELDAGKPLQDSDFAHLDANNPAHQKALEDYQHYQTQMDNIHQANQAQNDAADLHERLKSPQTWFAKHQQENAELDSEGLNAKISRLAPDIEKRAQDIQAAQDQIEQQDAQFDQRAQQIAALNKQQTAQPMRPDQFRVGPDGTAWTNENADAYQQNEAARRQFHLSTIRQRGEIQAQAMRLQQDSAVLEDAQGHLEQRQQEDDENLRTQLHANPLTEQLASDLDDDNRQLKADVQAAQTRYTDPQQQESAIQYAQEASAQRQRAALDAHSQRGQQTIAAVQEMAGKPVSPEAIKTVADAHGITPQALSAALAGLPPPPKAEGFISSLGRELYSHAGETVGTVAGGLIGGAGGTALGGLAGIETGPGALLTAGAGGIAGELAGGAFGGAAGRKIQNYLMGDKNIQTMQAQLAADEQAHPWVKSVGDAISFFVGMLGGGASTVSKLAAGVEKKAIAKATEELAAKGLTGPVAEAVAKAQGSIAAKQALISGANPFIERAIKNTAGAARAGGSQAAVQQEEMGQFNPLDILKEGIKQSVVMAPLAILPEAKSLLNRFVARPALDSAALAVSNAAYENVVEGKPIDVAKIQQETGANLTGIEIQNIIGAILHRRGINQSTKIAPETAADHRKLDYGASVAELHQASQDPAQAPLAARAAAMRDVAHGLFDLQKAPDEQLQALGIDRQGQPAQLPKEQIAAKKAAFDAAKAGGNPDEIAKAQKDWQAATQVQEPALELDANGNPILKQKAIDEVQHAFPTTGKTIGMTEEQARQHFNDRAAAAQNVSGATPAQPEAQPPPMPAGAKEAPPPPLPAKESTPTKPETGAKAAVAVGKVYNRATGTPTGDYTTHEWITHPDVQKAKEAAIASVPENRQKEAKSALDELSGVVKTYGGLLRGVTLHDGGDGTTWTEGGKLHLNLKNFVRQYGHSDLARASGIEEVVHAIATRDFKDSDIEKLWDLLPKEAKQHVYEGYFSHPIRNGEASLQVPDFGHKLDSSGVKMEFRLGHEALRQFVQSKYFRGLVTEAQHLNPEEWKTGVGQHLLKLLKEFSDRIKEMVGMAPAESRAQIEKMAEQVAVAMRETAEKAHEAGAITDEEFRKYAPDVELPKRETPQELSKTASIVPHATQPEERYAPPESQQRPIEAAIEPTAPEASKQAPTNAPLVASEEPARSAAGGHPEPAASEALDQLHKLYGQDHPSFADILRRKEAREEISKGPFGKFGEMSRKDFLSNSGEKLPALAGDNALRESLGLPPMPELSEPPTTAESKKWTAAAQHTMDALAEHMGASRSSIGGEAGFIDGLARLKLPEKTQEAALQTLVAAEKIHKRVADLFRDPEVASAARAAVTEAANGKLSKSTRNRLKEVLELTARRLNKESGPPSGDGRDWTELTPNALTKFISDIAAGNITANGEPADWLGRKYAEHQQLLGRTLPEGARGLGNESPEGKNEPTPKEQAPIEQQVGFGHDLFAPSRDTEIYRAGDADEQGVKAFSSWSEHKPTAEAYLDNPGFGGKTIRTEQYPLGNVLDADTTSRRGMVDLAEKLGFSSETGEEWFDNGWRYPWEESKKVKTALKESGFDAIRYTDDFPEGAKTIVPLKDYEPERTTSRASSSKLGITQDRGTLSRSGNEDLERNQAKLSNSQRDIQSTKRSMADIGLGSGGEVSKLYDPESAEEMADKSLWSKSELTKEIKNLKSEVAAQNDPDFERAKKLFLTNEDAAYRWASKFGVNRDRDVFTNDPEDTKGRLSDTEWALEQREGGNLHAPSRESMPVGDLVSTIEAFHQDPHDETNWPKDLREQYQKDPLKEAVDNGDYEAAYPHLPEDVRNQAKHQKWFEESKRTDDEKDMDAANEWLSDKGEKIAKEPYIEQASLRAEEAKKHLADLGYKWDKASKTFEDVRDEQPALYAAPRFIQQGMQNANALRQMAMGNTEFTDSKKAINRMGGDLQAAHERTAQAYEDLIKQVPDRKTREAMTLWAQANGNAGTLRNWEALPDKRFAAAAERAQSLSPEEQRLARGLANNSTIQPGKSGHLWERPISPAEQERLSDSQGNYRTFADAIQDGFKPKTLDAADLFAQNTLKEAQRRAEIQLEKDMRAGKTQTGKPLAVARQGAPDNYKTHPAFPGSAFHPEAFKYVTSAMGQSALREWQQSHSSTLVSELAKRSLGVADALNRAIKTGMFGFGAFHAVTEATHALGHHINPFGAIVKFDPNNPEHMDAVHHGLMLAHDSGNAADFAEGLGSAGWTQKIPLFGKLSKAMSDFTFKKYIPSLKLRTYDAALDRNMKRFAEDISSGKVTADDVKYMTAKQVNDAYGHLNYKDMAANPTLRHIASLALLAPDFLEARARFAGSAAQGIFKKQNREQTMAMATLAGAFFVGARVLNAILNDGDTKPDHPFSVISGNREISMRSVPEDIFSAIHDPGKFISARLSPFASTSEHLLTGKDYAGRKQSPLEAGKDLAKNAVPISLREVPKFLPKSVQDLPGMKQFVSAVGDPNTKLSPLESMLGSLGLHYKAYSPINDAMELAHKYEVAHGKSEDQVFPPSKFGRLKDALSGGNMDAAKSELSELQKTMGAQDITKGLNGSIFRPFVDAKYDKGFKASLSDKQKQVIAKAEQERVKLWSRYMGLTGQGAGLKTATVTPRPRLKLPALALAQ